MRRISLIIALLVLTPAASQARHSQLYRTRYHPYAFNYHNSGLIPGGLRYHPYAFNYRNSGLTFAGARYHPYAFNYHSSGLIVDCYWRPTPVCPSYQSCSPCSIPRDQCTIRSPLAARRSARRHAISSEKLREIRQADGMHVIRQYLKAHDLDNVEISHRLSVKNRTGSVVFILRDQGLIIRYNNPEVMAALETESGAMEKAIERHEARWEVLAKSFQDSGGATYCVNTAEKDRIVAALDDCPELTSGDAVPNQMPLYAKK
ncbi:MAG: hypothetical protein JSW27_17060 [Phycisphaerales bacterium]|nr:MAG: hypothetical protein JSW27_17060 [Phycisphaerales bacterium]